MKRSELRTVAERTAYEDGFDDAMRLYKSKSRYDRYVCAVASGVYSRHPDMVQGSEVIAMNALLLMLAADKRWVEYTTTTKGGEDGTT